VLQKSSCNYYSACPDSFSSPEEAVGQKETEGLLPEEIILLAKGERLFKFPEKSKSKISTLRGLQSR
jgi:hypothetical protein